MQKRKFQTFDALRFFAYFKVFLFHLPIVAFPLFNLIKDNGGIGVLFFFVLSGFLITYIILEEKEQTGSLKFKNFFLRRILRIWPLYFLMIAFSYLSPYLISALGFSSSEDGYKPQLIYSLTFTENYKMIMENDHPNVSPLGVMWSLCIEEHFYIVWGLLLFFIHRKFLPAVFIISVFIGIISRIIFYHNDWKTIDLLTNIDIFAMGAIPAWLLITYREKFENIIRSIRISTKYLFLILTIAAVYILPLANYFFEIVFLPVVLAGFFSILIMLIIPGEKSFRIPESNMLTKWGVWTYGLYLYHTIIINLFVQVFARLNWSLDIIWSAGLFALICFSLTLIISKYSYLLFEKPFLKLKRYFY